MPLEPGNIFPGLGRILVQGVVTLKIGVAEVGKCILITVTESKNRLVYRKHHCFEIIHLGALYNVKGMISWH